MIDKRRVARHFSRRATVYEKVTPVQQKMGKQLLGWVQKQTKNKQPDRLLELGCGTGILTRQLRQQFPQAKIQAVDLAPKMIRQAKKKQPPDPGLKYLIADAENEWKSLTPLPLDGIISNATVQWFLDPRQALARYAASLRPGGLLAWSTFGPDTFAELRQAFVDAAHTLGIPASPRTLDFVSPADWESSLKQLSNCRGTINERHTCVEYENFRAFLQAIRASGATNARTGTQRPLTPRLLATAEAAYTRRFPGAHSPGIRATFHEVYILLRRTQ